MMAQLLVALMIAALSTEVCTSYNSEAQEILKALRDLSHASAKSSGKEPADEVHSAGGNLPRTGWWRSKVVLPQTARKRQDASSYNLNSFGLRYGK
ncbi:metastasis-suppressor KiSS-1 [Clinocottus analis]|uniref:metastasis-suppressor KiSS-1 n=1 Tax=Clinocottus analis TaxID=304258 RepID=UPI0035C2071D